MNRTFVWGHRGSGFIGVQNSLSSFRNAFEMGVDGFKTEAQISKDHEVFLTFQQNLKKNGGEVPISELNSEEIKAFELDNNESILTLPELFSEFKDHNLRYNFDIKTVDKAINSLKEKRFIKTERRGRKNNYLLQGSFINRLENSIEF